MAEYRRINAVWRLKAPFAVIAIVIAASGGCQTAELITPPAAEVFTLSSASGWAGGTVSIRSTAFRSFVGNAVLRVDTLRLPLTRLDDTSFAASVPPSAAGQSLPTSLEMDGASHALPPLTIHGFAETTVYPGIRFHDVYAGPPGGHAVVFGGEAALPGVGVAHIDLDTKAVTTISAFSNLGLRGPGATEHPEVFVVANGYTEPLELWRLFPSPVKLEVAPFPSDGRQAMRLSPDAWLLSSHHRYTLLTRTSAVSPWVAERIDAEEIEGVYMSPRLDRATIAVDYITTGLPVFTTTGETAYKVSQLLRFYGVGFSADGELLALAGGRGMGAERSFAALLLRASDGLMLGEIALDREPFAVVIDPVRPLLYIGVGNPDSLPSVLVYERPSLRRVGEMKAPNTELRCGPGSCYKGVIALSNQNMLHVFRGSTLPTRAYRFTLPAGNGAP